MDQLKHRNKIKWKQNNTIKKQEKFEYYQFLLKILKNSLPLISLSCQQSQEYTDCINCKGVRSLPHQK